MNRDEHEEEKSNSHTNCHDRREDDHQEYNFWEDNPWELRNRRVDHHEDRREDAGDLSKIIFELERRCTHMEMERRDKSIVVDKLLMGTCSPFTRRVSNYHLSEKLKVPQVISYAGNRDPLDHLENF